MHDVPANPCPACGYELEAATGLGHSNGPKPGDLSVCFNCGRALSFGPDLRVRLATDGELAELDDEARAYLRRAAQFIHARKPS